MVIPIRFVVCKIWNLEEHYSEKVSLFKGNKNHTNKNDTATTSSKPNKSVKLCVESAWQMLEYSDELWIMLINTVEYLPSPYL